MVVGTGGGTVKGVGLAQGEDYVVNGEEEQASASTHASEPLLLTTRHAHVLTNAAGL